MTTTAVNVYDLDKKKAHIGTLHVDNLKTGKEWQQWPVINFATGNTIGTGANLKTSEFRYKIDGLTLHMQGRLVISGGATTGSASASAYVLALPTGCVARAPTSSVANQVIWGVGTFYLLANATPLVGTISVDPDSTHNYLAFHGIPNGTDVVVTQWGHAAGADYRLTSANGLTFGFSATVELSPTCAAVLALNA